MPVRASAKAMGESSWSVGLGTDSASKSELEELSESYSEGTCCCRVTRGFGAGWGIAGTGWDQSGGREGLDGTADLGFELIQDIHDLRERVREGRARELTRSSPSGVRRHVEPVEDDDEEWPWSRAGIGGSVETVMRETERRRREFFG